MYKPRFNKKGIAIVRGGKRMFSREFRLQILEAVDRGEMAELILEEHGITKRELGRILAWRKRVNGVPKVKALAIQERTLRERLYEKAVGAVETSLDPVETIVKNSELLSGEGGMQYLPTVVGHLRNSGQNAIKVLEGLGDFRKGGDDIPRESPRQPLFHLPPGSQVDVQVRISRNKEESNGNALGSEGERNQAQSSE